MILNLRIFAAEIGDCLLGCSCMTRIGVLQTDYE